MTVNIHDCEQRSEAWFAARAGRLTASVADAIHAKLKSGGEPASRRDLRVSLAVERLTGRPADTDGFVSRDMQRGIDLEPAAFAAYEAATGVLVERCGFVERLDMAIGCSPDGVVFGIGEAIAGVVELKCPKSATHIGYLRDGRLPTEYTAQVMHQLLVTGAGWLDFVSYDDRLPEGMQLFRVRVTPAELDMSGHIEKVSAFLAEVTVETNELKALRERLALRAAA